VDIKDMEKRLKELEKQVAELKDLEAINRLQKSYGYYLEHWLYKDIIDLFADCPDTELNIMAGRYIGKEGVRRYFSAMTEMTQNPEFLHQIMQLSGVVDIDAGGKTAKGRWYGFGSVSLLLGEGVHQLFTDGIYTADYIKKDGKWHIWKLIWNPLYTAPPAKGWTNPERVVPPENVKKLLKGNAIKPDKPREFESRYPSGYIVPFHYKHPVTGKPSTEAKRNAAKEKKQK
jgi:hypothetical protein